jgi:hypothetical protein
MALDIETKDFEKEKRKVWLTSAMAALEGGMSGPDSADAADHIMLSFDARFGPENESKTGGTYSLATSLKFYERHALIGQRVIKTGNSDVPPVGMIKDFSDAYGVGLASVKWDSQEPDEEPEWVSVGVLQLIATPPPVQA